MDLVKFVKLMNLTTSPNDGEALNAIRIANNMLASSDLDWDEFISQKTIVINEIVTNKVISNNNNDNSSTTFLFKCVLCSNVEEHQVDDIQKAKVVRFGCSKCGGSSIFLEKKNRNHYHIR